MQKLTIVHKDLQGNVHKNAILSVVMSDLT